MSERKVPRYSSVETLIFDQAEQRQIAWVPGSVWPNVGDVIELGNPNRDAVVLGVRLLLPQVTAGEGPGPATVLVLISDADAGDTIRRPGPDDLLDDR